MNSSLEKPGRLSGGYTRLVIRLRWLIVLFWIGAVVGCTMYLPMMGAHGNQVASIIPEDSPAIRAEIRSIRAFGFPLTSRTVIVQRNPAGLSPYTEAESVLDALAVNQTQQRYPLLGALPLTNTLELFPTASERNTTVLTYLFMNPRSGFGVQQRAAQRYVDANLCDASDHTIGVAGSVPARAQQADLVALGLPVLELLTILAIVVLVGLNYRALLPPVVALAASGVSFLITLRLTGFLEQVLGLSVPAELEPLLVALLLGVVTDYTIFYLSGYRNQLRQTADRKRSASAAVATFTPIVLAAGLTVAAGTAALLAAKSSFFQAVGPALALSILVGLVVSVTLIPSLIAILGSALFWPSTPRPAWDTRTVRRQEGVHPRNRVTDAALVEWLVDRRHAAVVLGGCVLGLLVASSPLTHINLGIGFTQSLPPANPVRIASDAAAAGFAPGITAPTTILIERRGVTEDRRQLDSLQALVEDETGVAGVFGPADNLTPAAQGVVLAKSGNAARILVVFDHDPLGATAIDDLAQLNQRMPNLVATSGLGGARVSISGDTALAEGLVVDTEGDLFRIAIAAIVVNFLLLAIFLRALVAPIFLLVSSILALTAAMGLTTLVFQDAAGGEGLTFYVPFAAAVLLIALGSDYNIFGVGHVWELARHMSLHEAIARAIPESTRAIAAAGITLAVSFGMLVVIPLRPFRELAFAMSVGIVLDVVVIRSLVTPSMLVLVGPISGWPGGRFNRPAFLRRQATRARSGSGAPGTQSERSMNTPESAVDDHPGDLLRTGQRVLSRSGSVRGPSPHDWLGEMVADKHRLLVVGGGGADAAQLVPAGCVWVNRSFTALGSAGTKGRANVLVADPLSLPFDDNSFASVLVPIAPTALGSVEAVAAEMARVLTPGGVLVTMLPAHWPLAARDLPVLTSMAVSLRRNTRTPLLLDHRRLAAALTRAGLVVQSQQRERFEMPIVAAADAEAAIDFLHLPGLAPQRRANAVARLLARDGRVWVPFPLRRVVAEKPQT